MLRLLVRDRPVSDRRCRALYQKYDRPQPRRRFFIFHCYVGKGFADIMAGCDRIGIAIRTFRVHIDQAHLHRRQRIFWLTIAAVAFVTQPLRLAAPIDLVFRLPDVFTTTTKTERLEAHRFERDIARKNHQVSPRQTFAVFLIDRPEQPAGLVEVTVVRSAVEGRKALIAGTSTTTAIRDAMSSGAVPCHSDEKATVMTPVGRPPIL